MTYGIYSYRDAKTQFGPIWYDQNDEVAKRGFAMMMNQNVTMNFSPMDFDLFKLGEFDSENGQITPTWPIEYIVNGRAVMQIGVEHEKQERESE